MDRFKQELETALKVYHTKGPDKDDVIRFVSGIGQVVFKSKTLPSGLILTPVQLSGVDKR